MLYNREGYLECSEFLLKFQVFNSSYKLLGDGAGFWNGRGTIFVTLPLLKVMKALTKNIKSTFAELCTLTKSCSNLRNIYSRKSAQPQEEQKDSCDSNLLILVHSSPAPDRLEHWQSHNSSCEDHSLVGISVARLGLGRFVQSFLSRALSLFDVSWAAWKASFSGYCYYLTSLISTALSQEVSQNTQSQFF